jgi:hypothetical protein
VDASGDCSADFHSGRKCSITMYVKILIAILEEFCCTRTVKRDLRVTKNVSVDRHPNVDEGLGRVY